MSTITPSALAERLADPDPPVVLDIRPSSADAADGIDGCVSLPCYDALRRGDETALRDGLDRLPRDREIVTVCKQGIVAKRATRVLEDEGYDARTLRGGMSGWRGYQRDTLGYRLRSLWWSLR